MHIQNLSQYSSDFAHRKHGFGESKRRGMVGVGTRNSSYCVQASSPSFKMHIVCASIISFTDFAMNPENACLANKIQRLFLLFNLRASSFQWSLKKAEQSMTLFLYNAWNLYCRNLSNSYFYLRCVNFKSFFNGIHKWHNKCFFPRYGA